jgi:hypothetical protein
VALDQNNDNKGFGKLSEYAVHLEEDLKDALLRCSVDSDDSSKEQNRKSLLSVISSRTAKRKYICYT